ncbi:MAG TPA: ATP-binding protein [Candidatus Acidoferrales bacterium]|nr:ATP-binding protein [Candidatus Acidoferrales bacterium]
MSDTNREPGFKRTAEHRGLWVPADYAEPDDDDREPNGAQPPFPANAPTMPPPGPSANPLSFEELLYQQRDLRIRDDDPRPTQASEVVGQSDALEAARVILSSSSPSSMILTGPPGVGKTTIARLALELAKSSPTCRFAPDAPFVEVDCTTVMHDDRYNLNQVTSTVVDGYYGGAVDTYCKDMGLPKNSPMLNFGATAHAHGGVLFLDEIGELPPQTQNALLKVLEDGVERIRASRYDSSNTQLPIWYRHFFQHGVPAKFVLIGATTRSPRELMPALVSRCAIIHFRALTYEERSRVATLTAKKYGYGISPAAANLIGAQTEGGRDSARKVQVAVSRAPARGSTEINADDVPRGNVTLTPRAICVREGSHAVTLGALVADSRRCLRCGLRIPHEGKPGHCSCGRPATHSVVIADDEHAADDVCARCRELIGHACVAVRIDQRRYGDDSAMGVRR